MNNPTNAASHTRRSFYEVCIQGLGTLIAAGLAIPAILYLFVSPKTKKKSDWVQTADLAQLPVGRPEEVVYHRTRVDGWRVMNEKTTAWVVKLDNQHVVAYAPMCTHLACAYHWDEQQKIFVCPCHGSTFSMDGKVLGGPAPRPLDRYAIRIDNDKLFIGSQIIRA